MAPILLNFGGALLVNFYLGVIDPLPQGMAPLRRMEPAAMIASVAFVSLLILLAALVARRHEARLATWYTKRLDGAPADDVPIAVRRQVLNSAAEAAGLTFLMWLLAIVATSVLSGGARLVQAIIGLGIGGLVSSILVYFCVDLLWRPIIPVFFPGGNLSQVGALRVPVLGKLLLVFLLVALLPPVLLVNMAGQRAQLLLTSDNPQSILDNLRILQLFILGVAGLASVALAVFVTRGITGPLDAMKEVMQHVEQHDLDVHAAVTSNDELGYLAERLNDMVAGLRERERLKAQQQRLEQELAIAWSIQSSFLPKQLPQVPGWELAATLEPAKETSGDYYDVIVLPEGHIGVLVADVADKGMGAALFMALSRTLVRTFAVEYFRQPAEALRAANRRILADTHNPQGAIGSDLFVTAFLGVLNPHTGHLTYANAGHNPAFLLRPQETVDLPHTGIPLGIFESSVWEQKTVQLAPRDVLLLYSDGITEAQSATQAMFGAERMLASVRANLDQPAQVMQVNLMDAVRRFAGPAPQFDDMTVLFAVRGPV